MKSDIQLRSDVLAELAWDPAVDANEVGVIVREGVVTLTGQLDSYAQKFAAERAVLRVAGVRGLAVDLGVKLPASHERSDADIALAVQHALQWSALVPQGKIQAMVEKGHVTLRGDVAWEFQRAAAEGAVRNLLGVVAVANMVKLSPQASPAVVEKGIHEALARQADRAARHVEVAVKGSTVRLTGHVHSWAERDAVQGAAWAAPGVTTIVNELVVDD
jgi:osmotically-inducible protein OsmY